MLNHQAFAKISPGGEMLRPGACTADIVPLHELVTVAPSTGHTCWLAIWWWEIAIITVFGGTTLISHSSPPDVKNRIDDHPILELKCTHNIFRCQSANTIGKTPNSALTMGIRHERIEMKLMIFRQFKETVSFSSSLISRLLNSIWIWLHSKGTQDG